MSELSKQSNPGFVEGFELHRQGHPWEALNCYLRALRIDPDSPDILLAVGVALHDLEQYVDAVTVYHRLRDGGFATNALWHNLGNTLLALDRYQEAIDSYAYAVALRADDVEALVTTGTALEQMGDYRQALHYYEEALRRNPDCAEAHWNLALGLLRQGEYESGWREFAWRWQKSGHPSRFRNFTIPLWRGESLQNKSILVYAEQAFGDSLQFARYLPLVAELGAVVTFECPAPLVPLIAATKGVHQAIPVGTPLPTTDYFVPLLDLPEIFKTTIRNIPMEVPYISPPLERIQRWQLSVHTSAAVRIGLVWAGRRRPDPHRSCSLAALAPLASLTGIEWYSLQIGEGAEQLATPPYGMHIVDLTAGINDFADTAALIFCLDLVVSIDTSVAHLAGAMGKSVFLLLPFASDWRWMLQRSDSPWYPSMRVFRQDVSGCWAKPVEYVTEAIQTLRLGHDVRLLS